MAGRKCMKGGKYLAKLAEKNAPCAFCKRNVDEETLYGKLYSIGDIHCHYFCVLLSCCLIQKGNDEEGLFGFMYPDILAEVERSKKHRCSFCGMEGATLGCSVTQCKKQFHLPCGREKKAVSLYFGNYKSFCEKHAPKQKIPSVIMSKAKSRLNAISKDNREKSMRNLKTSKNKSKKSECTEESECVCVICYESVDGFPTTETFWPPCCARDAWFHRSCLQRMALSAGMHYLKCPLCNDKQTFSSAILEQGYFIPDRDAAWELEQNAFSEIYERPAVCLAVVCHCAKGREFDADSGSWDIKLCVLCGGPGSHAECLTAEFYVCAVCAPAAPDTTHLAAISAVSLPSHDQSPQRTPSGPVMPSRMSLRRTKQKHTLYTPSCSSQNLHIKTEAEINAVKSNTDLSREDLNLKTPKRPPTTIPTEHKQLETTESSSSPLELLKQPEHELSSPLKLLKQGLHDRIPSTEVERVILDRNILEEMREKFKIPKPACVKKRIVGEILQGLLDYITNEENIMECMNSTEKIKEPMKEATTDENKENILDLTMKNSGEIQTEDLSSMHDDSMTPENVPDISEKDISEPLEENILQSSIVEQLIICGNTNFTPKKGEISCSLKKENLSLKYYTSKLPEHISECSEQNSSSSGVQFRKHKVSEPLEENILQLSTLEKLIICENASLTPKKKEILEENSRSSSNSSPFQLPPEFIAESSNSTPIIETPKKLKKINIENDSMEISENNQIVNIDLVKGENKPLKDYKVPEKCAFKLSPLNKNILEKNLDIDLESFKNHYLNEVDKKFICKFEHNLSESEKSPAKLSTDIDFALDGLKKPPKRKLPTSDNVANKRRKTTEMVRKSKKQPNDRNNDKNRNKTHNDEKSDQKRRYKKRSDHDKIKDKFDSTECNGEKKKYKKRKYKNNHNTELSIRNRNINLKIRFKSEELDLKISKPKKRGRSIKKENPKILKQYVLKYPTEKTSTKDCIARPDTDVSPIKRKYNIKSEKSCDNLKQTSIANFFKISLKTEIEQV